MYRQALIIISFTWMPVLCRLRQSFHDLDLSVQRTSAAAMLHSDQEIEKNETSGFIQSPQEYQPEGSGQSDQSWCTERLRRPPGKSNWWNFKERLAQFNGKQLKVEWNLTEPGKCLNALGELEWLQAIDGWAQAAWGTASFHAFNGTMESKNLILPDKSVEYADPKVKGDFISDHRAMLQRVETLGGRPLDAATVEFLNGPVLSHLFRVGYKSYNYDPMADLEKKLRNMAESSCLRAKLDPKIAEQQLRDLDPYVFDSQGHRHQEPTNEDDRYKERLGHLQRYLDDFNEKIAQVQPDDHVARIKALALLKWRIAWLHPFFDGNGRTRELVVQRELCRLGYHPVVSFDNNGELFYQTLQMVEDQLVEAFFLWEDAYALHCIPWTPDLAKQHREKFGAQAIGLPDLCSSEMVHRQQTSSWE